MKEKWKIDITSQIKGHIQDGEVILTFNGKPISRHPLPEDCEHKDFLISEGRVFKETPYDALSFQEEYAKDCDMGWC